MNADELKELLPGFPAGEITEETDTTGAEAFAVPVEKFALAARGLKAASFRLVAEWATDDSPFGGGFSVYAAYSALKGYIIIRSGIPRSNPSFPTLARKYVSALRFERQIHSLMGVVPEGHPDLRPWIKHEDWPHDAYPLRKDFDPATALKRGDGEYGWARAEGEGVYEIAVGPVHAGIIEPGHFRFQAVGEDIINLETRFGYVHKGVEKRFEALSWEEGARLAGRVSGDTTVAHATAYCRAVEAAAGCFVDERADWIRAVLLERERIANHLGDIGAICNDAAFTFMLYQTAILREKILRTNKTLFGHRLTMDAVVPGGVAVDIPADAASIIVAEMREIRESFERLVEVYDNNPSLEDRTYEAGTLKPADALELGVVGFVARSSGQRLDARLSCPYPPYDRLVPNVTVLNSGDVHARTWARVEEVRESIRLVAELVRHIPAGALITECPSRPLPGSSGFAAVEGWRGEIIYWIKAGPDGGITRCMARDPSSVTWLAIERAIKGNIVPDFPLCNKSFNQSYSGNDV